MLKDIQTTNEDGPCAFNNYFRNWLGFRMGRNRKAWLQAYRDERRRVSHEIAQDTRALRGSLAIAQNRLSSLFGQVQADVASQIEALRQRDNFISSGKSLYAAAAHETENPVVPFKKLVAPPLPYIGKLPPNK